MKKKQYDPEKRRASYLANRKKIIKKQKKRNKVKKEREFLKIMEG